MPKAKKVVETLSFTERQALKRALINMDKEIELTELEEAVVLKAVRMGKMKAPKKKAEK